ncbi:MAG: hypothetical protein L3J07_00760 [Candidatus Magasanikbacteria bacterium]|nr:hypothetical protein [Candidatus Magasanikbacteria bacterium]
MNKIYTTKNDVLKEAKKILNQSLRDIMIDNNIDIEKLEQKLFQYNKRRKGLLGELVEEFVFGLNVNNNAEADFVIAGIELKTNPLKKSNKKDFVSKERLVFSMINYNKIVNETWENSSFLKKNKVLLLMFYLWLKDQSILDYEFKFVHLLDLLNGLSGEDIYQIQKDWEYIVAKIKRGEAHLLSEGDTYYLGACTKAANSRVVRDQPKSRILAKPRAFSFKQQYLNFLIQKELLGKSVDTESIFKKKRRLATVEDIVKEKFSKFIGKTDLEIKNIVGWEIEKKPKSWKRLLANRMLGVKSNKIEELEKGNIKMKVITLEYTGTLRESLSFPAFNYKDLITQVWYDDENQKMSDLYELLETKKFLFVVFQKQKDSKEIIFRKIKFWNFPMKDLLEVRNVWDKTIDCINNGEYKNLPKMSENGVAHVRPHGKNSKDTIETPQKTQETKRSFWLNAKYIQKVLENDID